ncbi:dihydroorotate dehydrogenase (quinone) [Candidatus Peregrinibacteria bacterium CG11_big_fil_rev_8_21_14_0_20_41_10]|nr:MAG: dihydroorotate dehydrogenase (quinone) [Candidatus Peregrinibacteria bacterium CG11_big_fil_rev_8_21_14_0_20_41_10]
MYKMKKTRKIIAKIYQVVLKPLFFKLDPEFVHDRMIAMGSLLGRFKLLRIITAKFFLYQHQMLEQDVAGIKFVNPVGLSAGFDKEAKIIKILPAVGFGYVQIGSVTYNAYVGNPKPRLYRLPKSEAIVVYYGLKNEGIKKIAERIMASKPLAIPFSLSIAKTNCAATVGKADGIADYKACLAYALEQDLADMYTINISCPNAFGGEPFTDVQSLQMLLVELYQLKINRPLFIKMPINLVWSDFKALLDVIVQFPVAGVIIGNLSKDRMAASIKDLIPAEIKGGISGKPTEELCNHLIKQTYKEFGKKLVIVGVGGIFSAEDAYKKIKLGASLVQLITGMIYKGPQLIGEINEGLVELLKKDGYSKVSEAVGVDV